MEDLNEIMNELKSLKEHSIELNCDLLGHVYISKGLLENKIQEKLAEIGPPPIPFSEMKNETMVLQICYAYYFGEFSEETKKRLGLSKKRYYDIIWCYHHYGYKRKVVKFLK